MTAYPRVLFSLAIVSTGMITVLSPYFLTAGLASDRARATVAIVSALVWGLHGVWMYRSQVTERTAAAAPIRELSLLAEPLPGLVWLAAGPPILAAAVLWWVVAHGSVLPMWPRVSSPLAGLRGVVFAFLFWNGMAVHMFVFALATWHGMSRAYPLRRTLLLTALANEWLILLVTLAFGALSAVRVPEDLEFVLIVVGISGCAGLGWNLWRINRLFYADHPRAGRWFYLDGHDPAFYGPRGINMANRWFWVMHAMVILQVLLIRWILPQV